jgi:hypothetical protein
VKKYLPDYALIPSIMILGGFGAVIMLKAVPTIMAWVAAKVPTVIAPKAA